ncbi:hypothetical protein ACHFCA_21460 [Delftia tsuruhatensis]
MNADFEKIRHMGMNRSIDDSLNEGQIFKALFLRRSPEIIENIFPLLKKNLESSDFQSEFLRKFHAALRVNRDLLLADAERCAAAGSDARFYLRRVDPINCQLSISSFDEYLKFLSGPSEGHREIQKSFVQEFNQLNNTQDGAIYVRENYHLYEIGNILFTDFCAKLSLFEEFSKNCASELSELYKNRLGIDLAATDAQFRKYGLLSAGENFSILKNKEQAAIHDERIDLYFSIEVPREPLAAIEKAITNNWIGSIAFNIKSIKEIIPTFEAIEYGSIFNFNSSKLPSVSKLYDEERYEDALWIQVAKDPASMTFEELCDDFPALDGHIITQVLHLEFIEENGESFITHLDHEYILYTNDSYELRRYNPNIKGHKKCKTFKIDRARIPFNFIFNDRYFLFLILDSYFKNKGLIKEYFSDVSKQPASNTEGENSTKPMEANTAGPQGMRK